MGSWGRCSMTARLKLGKGSSEVAVRIESGGLTATARCVPEVLPTNGKASNRDAEKWVELSSTSGLLQGRNSSTSGDISHRRLLQPPTRQPSIEPSPLLQDASHYRPQDVPPDSAHDAPGARMFVPLSVGEMRFTDELRHTEGGSGWYVMAQGQLMILHI